MERKRKNERRSSRNVSLMFQALARLKLKTATSLTHLAWERTSRCCAVRHQKAG